MASTVTLSELRAQIRELFDDKDLGDENAITDTRLDALINGSGAIWYGMVARAIPELYETEDTVTATGAASYSLPAAYLYTLGVEYESSSDIRIDLKEAMFQERNRFPKTTSSVATGFRVVGSNLVLMPAPASGTYYHQYVPEYTKLVADGDTLDGVNGWDKWIVYDVVLDLMAKEESSNEEWYRKYLKLEKTIKAAAAQRNLMSPRRVVDVRRRGNRRDPDFENLY